MNDINEMPLKCQYCPYWEVCEYPWVCPDREQLATNLKPTCNQLATDTISRQVAIEALRTCYDTEAITYTNGNEYIDYDQALDLINTLPPVQPKPKTEKCKWIRYDYRTICPKYHDIDNPYWRIPEKTECLKYCPYCGKEIEVEK